MRALAIVCVLAAGCSGCGNGASAPPDGAAAPPDVSPPPPAPVIGYQWQRDLDKLLMGYTHAVMTSSGVLVVNDGHVYLYDTSGNKVATAEWPAASSADARFVDAVLVRGSGNVAIAFRQDDRELVVIEYSLPDLSQIYETKVLSTRQDAALVERDGVLYALCSTGSSLNLYQLDDSGNVVKTTALATVPDDSLEGVAAVATDGTILACAGQDTLDSTGHVKDEFTNFLRIDPATGKVTTLRLSDAGSRTCDLVRGRNHLLAAWPAYSTPTAQMQWAILDQDGTKILARGGDPSTPDGTDFAYEDGRFLMIGLNADPEIYAIDENTAAPLGPFHLKHGPYPAEQFTLYSEGIAADGRQVYAAFLVSSYAYGVLRLQKLDPLPR